MGSFASYVHSTIKPRPCPVIRAASGHYNHYTALRSYEDLLGVHTGGSDGAGHLAFASTSGLAPFGNDVFNTRP